MVFPSPEELQKFAQIDPEINAIVKSGLFQPSIDFSNPEKAIFQMREITGQIPIPPPIPEVKEYKATYPCRDGSSLDLCVFAPIHQSAPLPLFVWYHGGGGCIGSPEFTAPFCRGIALDQKCVVIAPQYRLGPEFKYPTGINDSWDALKHIASHAADFAADPANRGFIVAGESNGGVTVAALTLLARDQNLAPPLTGVLLSAASFIPPDNVPEKYKEHYVSRRDPVCLNSPTLSQDAKDVFDICYAGDYTSPLYRTILWPTGHRGLPRSYFQSCGFDINRDDSFIYQDLLEENGVETRLDVYPGGCHCFWAIFGTIQQTAKWKQDTAEGLAWLLRKTV